MKFISLFAGIGGFDMGFERAGMTCIAQVEIDEFCQKVLAKHWPSVPRFGDIRDVGKELPYADVIVGGYPCNDTSTAGRRLGLDGSRSTLWDEYARIVGIKKPKYVVAENPPGVLSVNNGRFFGKVLSDLAGHGYDAFWFSIPACAFGAPHTRKRVFIVAYPTGNGLERELRETILQEADYLSSKALGTWNGISNSFAKLEKFMGSPGTCRLDDGVSSTLAVRPALRSYGNAVVPQVAEFIGRAIMAAEQP